MPQARVRTVTSSLHARLLPSNTSTWYVLPKICAHVDVITVAATVTSKCCAGLLYVSRTGNSEHYRTLWQIFASRSAGAHQGFFRWLPLQCVLPVCCSRLRLLLQGFNCIIPCCGRALQRLCNYVAGHRTLLHAVSSSGFVLCLQERLSPEAYLCEFSSWMCAVRPRPRTMYLSL